MLPHQYALGRDPQLQGVLVFLVPATGGTAAAV